MAQVSIPESCVAPMEHFAAGITGLRLAFVNVFAVSHPDGSWTLVDAGLPFCTGLIGGWAEKRFRNPPTAIALTHGHFDHVSSARELAEKWDVPIFAHPLEFPYLTGKESYPAPDFSAAGGLMSLLSP
ncbi:MAG: MBL fold metallo-hydrolase, partial [Acidobacteriaceae bacterium]